MPKFLRDFERIWKDYQKVNRKRGFRKARLLSDSTGVALGLLTAVSRWPWLCLCLCHSILAAAIGCLFGHRDPVQFSGERGGDLAGSLHHTPVTTAALACPDVTLAVSVSSHCDQRNPDIVHSVYLGVFSLTSDVQTDHSLSRCFI